MFANGSGQTEQLYRGPSIYASCQVSVHMVERFQRRRLKCEKLTDDRRRTTDDGRRTTDDGRRRQTTDDGRQTTDDGRQVMAKVNIAFGKVS
jgi:hypothetical protein